MRADKQEYPLDLGAAFRRGFKPRNQWRTGIEAERFAVHRASGAPLGYSGPRGIERLFDELMANGGWHPVRELPDGPVIALSRGQCGITLEPGGQVELSGSPHVSLRDVQREYREHLEELAASTADWDLQWLCTGFHPHAAQGDMEWVPKERYKVMRAYLPQRGRRALDMMLRTTTVQVSFDFSDERDAMEKLAAALRISPLVSAMFANSPFMENRRTDVKSQRMLVWRAVDPERTGLLKPLWSGTGSFDRYIDWCLDAHMFLVERNRRIDDATRWTFREFLSENSPWEPTMPDWETHLSTMFPEVRLKNTIEVRGVDGQRPELIVPVAALWKGLLYGKHSVGRVLELTEGWDADVLDSARVALATEGISGKVLGRPTQGWAQDLVRIALDGLDGWGEADLLDPVATMVDQGKCPADRFF